MGGPSVERPRWPLTLAALAGALLAPVAVRAQSLGDTQVKITETAVFDYHFKNRDNDPTHDRYYDWLNRFNIQATNGPFTAALRLDSAFFAHRPNPNELAVAAAALPPSPGELRGPTFLQDQTARFGQKLATRYINTLYPSKLSFSYTAPGLDVTVGDFYAQFGRGLILALHKTDELGTDTTLRGGKVELKKELGPARVNVTFLAGGTNPLRVDEVSGRVLTERASIPFAGMPAPHAVPFYAEHPEPTFATDTIVGGKIEAGPREIQLGVQAVGMSRGAAAFQQGNDISPERNAQHMYLASVSASVPNLGGHGSFYVEAAQELLQDAINLPTQAGGSDAQQQHRALLERISGGHAVYAQLTAFEGPFTLSLELKHYDRFFPMLASVSANDALEFRALQYNVVPTTEQVTNDTMFEQFNVCTTGGRARLDARASPSALFYASLGRYSTWTEQSQDCGQGATVQNDGSILAPRGKNNAIRNDIWDAYAGIETDFELSRSHLYGSVGVRFDDTAEPSTYDGLTGQTSTYYREFFVRYDALKKLGGPFSAQAEGLHRYRFHPLESPLPWREGENYLSLVYAPHFSGALGYEYTTKGGSRTDYYNAQVQYRISTDKKVRLFVGQTRPGLRCVSGVCRQFPAFEGVKLEVVLRF